MEELRESIINMMTRNEYKLKPCPFCGNYPSMMSRSFFESLDEENGSACISISCKHCNLDFRDHTHDEHNYFIRAFLVAEKWNAREENEI